jgi:hypothetical protein
MIDWRTHGCWDKAEGEEACCAVDGTVVRTIAKSKIWILTAMLSLFGQESPRKIDLSILQTMVNGYRVVTLDLISLCNRFIK